jgi:CheY-like chemotaxis protein
LINLCVNARDAMPDGGVLFLKLETVTLDACGMKVHPRAKPGSYVVFHVSDSGAGIPQELMERILDPFFTTKPLGKGTGLGLSTVLGIVENHDGFLLVESKPGQGSTFRVYLPSSPPDLASAFSEESSTVPFGAGKLVLVVDDEVAIVRLAETVLRRGGYETLTAANSSEAMQLYMANRDRIKGVLTDIMMPFGDGRQLVLMLSEQSPKLPIVAMSGLSSIELRRDLKTRGACQFLSKPFTAETLLTTMAQALRLQPN